MFGRRWWPSVIVVIALGALLPLSVAYAGDTSNHAAPYLRMGAGARAMGMGGAFVGVANDVTANYWNPAGLVYATGTQLHGTLSAGMNVDRTHNYFAVSHSATWGSVALGWLNAGVSDIPQTNDVGTEQKTFDFGDNGILLSYARGFDMVSAGLTAKLLFESVGADADYIGDDSNTGFGLDMGLSVRLTEYARMGLAIQDIATKLGGDDKTNSVPANLRAGLAAVPVEGLTLAFDVEKTRDDDQYRFHAGGEYMMPLGDNFSAGARLGMDDGRFAGGLGFRVSVVDIDYAYVIEPEDFLDESHRVSVGLAFGREEWTGGKKVKDRDLDGIADDVDKCPDQAEDFDGYEDLDGCPEADNDGDGILDAKDKCPNQAEDFDGFQDDDGCPDLDNDMDGILDADDKCPGAKETFNNYQDTDGCPDEAPIYFPMAWINFKFGTAEIVAADPIPVLEEVVRIMKEYPDITVAIEGHTDNIGSDESNMTLGTKRSEAVKQYLVNKGIAADRFVTKSFGESKPIDTNDTELGRARNRRIEFHQIMK
jgi:outer membrane protein OmpA-like peptidoglycan-associated protein